MKKKKTEMCATHDLVKIGNHTVHGKNVQR